MLPTVISLLILVVSIKAGFLRRQELPNVYDHDDVTHAPPIDSPNVPILYPPSSPPRHCHEKHSDDWDHPKNKHIYGDEEEQEEEDERDSNYSDGGDDSKYKPEGHKDSSNYDGYKYKMPHKDEDRYKDSIRFNNKYEDGGYYENPKYDYNYGGDNYAEDKKSQSGSKKGNKTRGGKSLKNGPPRKNKKMKYSVPDNNDFHGVVNKSGNGLHLFRVGKGTPVNHQRFY